jgi:hypothetical protein
VIEHLNQNTAQLIAVVVENHTSHRSVALTLLYNHCAVSTPVCRLIGRSPDTLTIVR